MNQRDDANGSKPGSRRVQVATGVALVGIVFLVVTLGGLWRPTTWASPTTSPSIFPMMVLSGLGLCGLLIVLGVDRGESDHLDPKSLRQMGITLAGVACYTLLLPLIGWIPASILVMVLMPLLLGYRQLYRLALFVTLTTAISWLVFGSFVRIPLSAFP